MHRLQARAALRTDSRGQEMTVTLDPFADEAEIESFPAGTTVFREGDAGDKMYVVLFGEVALSINGHRVETIGSGGILGEMALVDSGRRSATATIIRDARLAPITAQRFKTLVQKKPEFALQIMRLLATRLRRMDALVE
jgi:CRP/FNR family transcriptional regulator, cyclic AMP receptor protein